MYLERAALHLNLHLYCSFRLTYRNNTTRRPKPGVYAEVVRRKCGERSTADERQSHLDTTGWTPTTTSPRFQLVSQVACLDANSGCSRWGDRTIAFRRRSPSLASVVVVADLAVPSQRALRFRSLLRSLLPQSLPPVVPALVLAQRSRAAFPTSPALSCPPPCGVRFTLPFALHPLLPLSALARDALLVLPAPVYCAP